MGRVLRAGCQEGNLGSGEMGGKAPWVPDRRSKSSEVRWVSLGKKTAWGVNRVTRNKVEVRDDKHGLEAVAAMKVAKGTCVSRRLTWWQGAHALRGRGLTGRWWM